MAYSHITPASMTDLANAIRAFAVSDAGFTNEAFTYTFGGDRFSAVTLNGVSYVLANSLSTSCYIEYNSTDTWPPVGTPDIVSLNNSCPIRGGVATGDTVPADVYMYATDNFVHCVMERQPGAFVYLGFGELSDGTPVMTSSHVWNYTQADYRYASHLRPFDGLDFSGDPVYYSHARIEYDGKSFGTFGYGSVTFSELRGTPLFTGAEGGRVVDVTPNASGANTLELVEVVLKKAPISGPFSQFWQRLGRVPGMAMVNITDLTPGDTVLVGWHAWPLSAKGFDDIENGVTNSENIGMAFLL